MRPDAYVEMADVQDRHWWFMGRREIFRSTIARLRLPEPARILEIGAGTGGNLGMLSQFGVLKAVERDEYARQIATERTNWQIDIRSGYLPNALPFTEEFDLVCLFDVLEHVERDIESLDVIRQLVSPGGYLLLSVPAYQWLWSAHDERLHHVRRYTASELTRKARLASWVINRVTYFNTLLFPLAAIARMADKLLSHRHPTGTGLPAPWINALLFRVFATESALLRKLDLPFGVSLLAELRRG